jgi:hypothetical protein
MKLGSANPEKAAAVEAIASALARLQPGEVVAYAQLHNLMLGDRNLLYRARRQVEESHGYIFGAVRGVGIKRLSNRVVIVDALMTTTKRAMDRTEKRVVGALLKDGSTMSRQEKAELNSSVAHINAIQLAVKLARGR